MIKAGDLVLCIDDDWTDPGRLESMVSRVHVKLAPKKGTVWLVTGVGHNARARSDRPCDLPVDPDRDPVPQMA
jgi:hypothetical protein